MAFCDQSSEHASNSLPASPTIHVELCQKPSRYYTNHNPQTRTADSKYLLCSLSLDSTLRPCLLRDSAVALLKRRGSTFGDLNLVQFDDPLLEEHAQFLAVVDIPSHVSVCTPPVQYC